MTHETLLRRSRQYFIPSTALFVLFCLLGGGSWAALLPAAWAKSVQILSQLSGIFAWSLMSAAYGFRRRAL